MADRPQPFAAACLALVATPLLQMGKSRGRALPSCSLHSLPPSRSISLSLARHVRRGRACFYHLPSLLCIPSHPSSQASPMPSSASPRLSPVSEALDAPPPPWLPLPASQAPCPLVARAELATSFAGSCCTRSNSASVCFSAEVPCLHATPPLSHELSWPGCLGPARAEPSPSMEPRGPPSALRHSTAAGEHQNSQNHRFPRPPLL
jgi:hypothetical protein